MKNKLKLVTFVLVTLFILCGSLKAQQGTSFSDWYEQRYKEKQQKKQAEFDVKRAKEAAQREQEQAQKVKHIKDNIQAGVIIAGILAIPLIITSITLITSKLRENKL